MPRDGDKMLEVKVNTKTFGDQTLLEKCELDLNLGDRLSILGSTGIGK